MVLVGADSSRARCWLDRIEEALDRFPDRVFAFDEQLLVITVHPFSLAAATDSVLLPGSAAKACRRRPSDRARPGPAPGAPVRAVGVGVRR
jgi:hypothetical protein